ncbi:hypothetical protein SAMN05421636_104206 [Pricia antarctica]|uniref:DNA topoisomerase IV n=1 Tax=Pricia antarctica TaxID=641691 RepID=A0A1G7BMH8_9FLAO|nr:DNA topoisomerase IV [Pricia antarctica]SDE27860.1 hypothetical protein SAMN05421636_104206 [Pricia antarctica]
MIKRILICCLLLVLLVSCYQPQRDCKTFKNGNFTFTTTIGDEEKTTTFVRNDSIEIDYFEGKVDTSAVRWINDCEYVVKKINPKNKAEEKSVHMKILSTTEDSYTFEYGIVGESSKSRGTAVISKP